MFDGVIKDARGGGRRLGLLLTCPAMVGPTCVGATRASTASASPPANPAAPAPTITWDVARDVSPPLRDLAAGRVAPDGEDPAGEPDRGPISGGDIGYSADEALQSTPLPPRIPGTQQNFEGLSNEDNFNVVRGLRVNPPDQIGRAHV